MTSNLMFVNRTSVLQENLMMPGGLLDIPTGQQTYSINIIPKPTDIFDFFYA
jgi:hypothetical protein